MTCTIHEWLNAAEYILNEGNPNVILCERGIRTFETYTRFTLDLSSVPAVKALSHLPVIVDPSHGTGQAQLVGPMALAAIGAGADGLMIEVHFDPPSAVSDRNQALNPGEFFTLAGKIRQMSGLVRQFQDIESNIKN
jgi:3-deoxy-7-phosphoheptulonate synthase